MTQTPNEAALTILRGGPRFEVWQILAIINHQRADAVEKFATAVMHGDENHWAWLSEAAEAFNQGVALPKLK